MMKFLGLPPAESDYRGHRTTTTYASLRPQPCPRRQFVPARSFEVLSEPTGHFERTIAPSADHEKPRGRDSRRLSVAGLHRLVPLLRPLRAGQYGAHPFGDRLRHPEEGASRKFFGETRLKPGMATPQVPLAALTWCRLKAGRTGPPGERRRLAVRRWSRNEPVTVASWRRGSTR